MYIGLIARMVESSYLINFKFFRPSSGGSRGSDKSRIKSDKNRESALEAVRALTKPKNEKQQVTQV